MNSEIMKMKDGNCQKEPEPKKEPMRCEECGCIPYDNNLYNHDGDWLCSDCLLERFPVIDVWDS